MPDITIRNVSPEVVEQLAARAARRGCSLEEYLEYLVAQLTAFASRPDTVDVYEEGVATRARTHARAGGHRMSSESIVAHRGAERP